MKTSQTNMYVEPEIISYVSKRLYNLPKSEGGPYIIQYSFPALYVARLPMHAWSSPWPTGGASPTTEFRDRNPFFTYSKISRSQHYQANTKIHEKCERTNVSGYAWTVRVTDLGNVGGDAGMADGTWCIYSETGGGQQHRGGPIR